MTSVRIATIGFTKKDAERFFDFLKQADVKRVVDVADSPKNRQWMKDFKSRWKAKLDQLELWMVSYRIEIE